MKERMKESHIEGLAIHDDPESCAASRKAVREVLTGAHTGSVLSREIRSTRVPTLLSEAEGNIHQRRNRESLMALRGRRPDICVEPSCARTGRSH
jgi:hypothetical protein